MRSLAKAVLHDVRLRWQKLLLADAFYKLIALVALTPIVAILFQLFLSVSGRDVLADEDILYFFIRPLGWLCLLVVGSVSIATIALEQAALMAIVRAAGSGQRVGVVRALAFATTKAWPVLRLTARMAAVVLLLAAPFLAAGGSAYLLLLTEFDINFYLTEKPTEFWTAAAIGSVLASGLAAALASLAAAWLLALPILLFEDAEPRAALAISRQRTRGSRRQLALCVAVWAASGLAASAVATGAVNMLGRFVVPGSSSSLPLLVLVVGAMLVLWGLVHLGLSALLSAVSASLLVNLYQDNAGIDKHSVNLAATGAPHGLPVRLTRGRLVTASVLLGVVAAIVGVVFLRSVRLEDSAEVIAHRGSSAAAPENTLAAVLQAIDDGSDWVEIDVQETKDGEVVVMHDSDFKKVAGSDLKIWEATADDLKQLDVGSWFDVRFRDQRVPTLDEVLKRCRGRIRVNIELKYYGHDVNLEQRVIDVVESNEMQSEVAIMSLKHEAVKKVKQRRPTWKVGLLTAVALGDLTRVEADFLAVNTQLATRSFVRAAHRAGKEVYVWTVNDPLVISTMIGRGVDAVITDKPAVARRVLQERRKMGSLERLMVEAAVFFGARAASDLTIDDV